MLVVTVFIRQAGVGWLQRRYPALCQRLAKHPLAHRLASGLTRLQQLSA